jgi:hypothetical protein
MFNLYQPDYIEWPVSVDLPVKGGSHKAYKFTAHFRVLDQADCQELQDQHNELVVATLKRLEALQNYRYSKDSEAITEPLPCSYEDLADQVLCGWGDEVVDPDGEVVEFSDGAKARMYKIQGAAAAIFTAWVDSVGKPSEKSAAKAGGFRAKNS